MRYFLACHQVHTTTGATTSSTHHSTPLSPATPFVCDQAALFPEELRFERPVEQEQYIRWWLENRAKLGAPGDGGEANVDALKIRWYPAIYAPFLGSLVQEGDITQLVPKGERDVAILEEPEHLNW